ncbi:MAG: glycosyltransferase family 4 protein [Leptolyngbyaceae cyanobacterium SM1_1_3]|nr:glycosyltransferase family 4 protein [Leptolyngbyaceae cyanobacterium SM1_1_3]NJN01685.1 glycosyltransferase family 4 protein [Leptolyngbyaceae cyanobacterium RM1_1_2]
MTSSCSALKLLLLSTPVGPLGSGLGGGVELTLTNLSQELRRRGHHLCVAAPAGSVLGDVPVIAIAGQLQPTAHTQGRQTPTVLPDNAVLANMWDYARQVQDDYDLLVNFAYDWLPFYLMPFFRRPVAQFVSMGSLSTTMDAAVCQAAAKFPDSIGVYTRAQAETFPCEANWRILGSAVDLLLYDFCAQPQDYLVWLGRISPEKGLEDAIAAAQRSQKQLKILGKLEDQRYWDQIQQDYPTASVDYLGFLPTAELQFVVRQAQALLMTPRWIEAFGNVAIEALACGVPVIAYRRGGPAEIVQPGKTGWLVAPDSVDGLVEAIARIDHLDRSACRQQAADEYSLEAWGDRFEQWFREILHSDEMTNSAG